jgi:hypothetical protein
MRILGVLLLFLAGYLASAPLSGTDRHGKMTYIVTADEAQACKAGGAERARKAGRRKCGRSGASSAWCVFCARPGTENGACAEQKS